MRKLQPYLETAAQVAEELAAIIQNGDWAKIGLTDAQAKEAWFRFEKLLFSRYGERARKFFVMGTHFTLDPRPETPEYKRTRADLEKALRPTAEKVAAENRISDLMFDAAAKGDRAEFSRLWKQHILPRKKTAVRPAP